MSDQAKTALREIWAILGRHREERLHEVAAKYHAEIPERFHRTLCRGAGLAVEGIEAVPVSELSSRQRRALREAATTLATLAHQARGLLVQMETYEDEIEGLPGQGVRGE